MSYLNLENKNFLICGVANKKSVATFIAKALLEQKANVFLTVQNEENLEKAQKLFPDSEIIVCNVEDDNQIELLTKHLNEKEIKLDGFVHSIAFANFSDGLKAFHETSWKDYAQACRISCFSLTLLANQLKDILKEKASVITISISNTKATSYGYLGPIKAMLESNVHYLAKSFSLFSQVRFNAIGAGPLKTSASAGIPNYIENYVFSEQMTLRKKAVQTQEVADTALFLLSERSSGINATTVYVDAGMNCNGFDENLVKSAAKELL